MDEHEALLVIRGYQSRMNDFQEALSRFVAPLMNIHIPKGKKKVKPRDLFQRPKGPGELARLAAMEPEAVKDDRRKFVAAFKEDGAPKLKKHRRGGE